MNRKSPEKKVNNFVPSEGIKDRYTSLQDRSRDVARHIRRFGWDLLGTFLILVGVLSLLGLSGLSRGTIINSWTLILRRNFGWGSFLLVILVILLGLGVFRFGSGKGFPLSVGRVIALEGVFFTILPLVSLFGGLPLDRAIQGSAGGTLGWGLAQLVASVVSIPGAIVFYLILLFYFFGLASGIFSALVKIGSAWATTSPPQTSIGRNPDRKHTISALEKANKSEAMGVNPLDKWRDDRLPPLNLLTGEHNAAPDEGKIKENAKLIETTLAEFGIPVKVIGFRVGPTVTQFALEPGFVEKPGPDGVVNQQKVKVSQISALSRDLALALSASRLRIETPVPGKTYVGIEVPNTDNSFVRLRPILESTEFKDRRTSLRIGLGKNVSGEPVTVDLGKLPHLLIAGTTNSGKSVCITAIATCLIMNNTPADLNLVMLDPKMVELVRFNGTPHLLGKVETELGRMLAVLRWAQVEMDTRYRILAEVKSRNLENYNQKMLQRKKPTLPRIVILIDELADLMMNAPDQTEHSLIRLAQMARATGIHLVVATQRPSADVVTGLIKANFPSRISFAVASSVDSRVILDTGGAESLLGKGDMLFVDPQFSGLQRMQGIFVSDNEIEKVINHWQKITHHQAHKAAPWEEMVEVNSLEDSDQLAEKAISVVRAAEKASASLLQRKLRIGYPRAARLLDELEEMGVVGPSLGSGRDREVLMKPEPDVYPQDENLDT